MRNYATVEQARADERRMTKYVCDRIPEDGGRIVLLADGPEAWADLFPSWDEEYGWTLLIEANEPEWISLAEVYGHFRRRDMTGLEWEQAIFCELHAPLRPASEPVMKSTCASIPSWDADLGRLWCGDVLIKDYRQEAKNQRLILAAFQELEWRHRIDDPITGRRGEAPWQPKRRLRDTITGLNADHITQGVIRFRGDGTGTGVIWDWCE